MHYKILLDANVILDFLLKRDESAEFTGKILYEIEQGNLKGCLTTSIVQVTAYWLSKEWSYENTKMGILTLINHFYIIDSDKKTIISALNSNMTDIEDAMQYYVGISHNVDAIISRDKQFIKSALPVLPVYTPEDFIKEYL